MNAQHITEQYRTDTRRQLDAARVASALRHGELRRTHAERLDILVLRMRAHARAGRVQAAQACRRMVERLLDEMEAA